MEPSFFHPGVHLPSRLLKDFPVDKEMGLFAVWDVVSGPAEVALVTTFLCYHHHRYCPLRNVDVHEVSLSLHPNLEYTTNTAFSSTELE